MNLYSKRFVLPPFKHGLYIILGLQLFMFASCSSCTKYHRTAFIEGMYYPNGTAQLEGYSTRRLSKRYSITISHPFRVSELGMLTPAMWDEPWRGNYAPFQVGRSDISDAARDYYIPVHMLNNTGRFEYTERTMTLKEWIRDHPIWAILISIILLIVVIYVIAYSVNKQKMLRLKKEREAEEQRLREIREKQLRKEIEIQRRKDIVLDIINNLYKETETEVNKTLIPTLLNELYDIFNGLHSENLNDLILNGSQADFQNIINSIESELTRLKKLALDAQRKGYTNDESDYTYSDEDNGKMTKERAFEIFGLKATATKDEIKRAYRDLVKKYNTDQRTHYEEHIKQMLEDKMKEVNNAKSFFEKEGML